METLYGLAGTILAGTPQFTHTVAYPRGKRREIAAPNKAMRELHREAIRRLRQIPDLKSLLQSSYGGLAGRSLVQNASRHVHNNHVYQLDITGAYLSTPLDRLADVLSFLDPRLGDWFEIDKFLQLFCRGKDGGLAVGGPASPALFDLYCAFSIDREIRRLCPRATYTRYLDDLTISQKGPIPTILRKRIRKAVTDAGFKVSHEKSRVIDCRDRPPVITGVVLSRRGLRPKDEFLERLASLLRKPLDQMTVGDGYALNGLMGHLLAFSSGAAAGIKLAPVLVLQRSRALARLRQLSRRNGISIQSGEGRRRYSRLFLEHLRGTVPIVEVVGRIVKLRKSGQEYVGLCPIHREQTPSFTVSPGKHFYHCFGCRAHGDVIRFLMDVRKMGFVEAVEFLKEEYSI